MLVGPAVTGDSKTDEGSGRSDGQGNGEARAHYKMVTDLGPGDSRRSPLEFQRLLEEPGRVAPPEGHGAWLYVYLRINQVTVQLTSASPLPQIWMFGFTSGLLETWSYFPCDGCRSV